MADPTPTAAPDSGSLAIDRWLDAVMAGLDRITTFTPRQLAIAIGLTLVLMLASWLVRKLVRKLLKAAFTRVYARADSASPQADILRIELALSKLARLAILIVSGILLLEIWGFRVASMLVGGVDLGGHIARLGLILLLAVGAWHGVRLIVEFLLPDTTPSGLLATTRVKSVGPVLVGAGRFVIVVLAILLMLAEIGLNITPLLAGAGIVGLAVGFGAQSLVKDFLTGIMILAEDSAAIGDVVSVAGHTGVVEKMGVRSMRLRDLSGTLHVVPYGEVTTVENMTKDFAFAVFDIGVSYDSDVDKVMIAIRETAAELTSDSLFANRILDDIQILGVDSFGDNAVVIKARIKTLPTERWSVFREYNRLLKRRFDAEGIEIPFPQRTLHVKPLPGTLLVGEKS